MRNPGRSIFYILNSLILRQDTAHTAGDNRIKIQKNIHPFAYIEQLPNAGKKIKGIKRHVIVDVLGLLIGIIVHSAAIQDRDGAKLLLFRVKDRLPRVKLIWADGGYTGKLIKWVEDETSWTLEIVKRNELHTFKVLPKRWIVERTFGWLSYWRIMNRHHERKYDTAENIMRNAMIKNMVRFLTMEKQKQKAA